MSRCRANSFYVSVGQYRRFDTWDVHTRLNGAWVHVTHRKDIETLDADPSWDKVCYVTWKGMFTDPDGKGIPIEDRITTRPESVELWKLDARLVNGKRSGISHHLYAVAKQGSARAGGIRDAVGHVLGTGSVGKYVARWFSEQSVEPTQQAAALKLLYMAGATLDAAGLESLAARMSVKCAYVPIADFDISTAHNLKFLERYPMQRRVSLLLDVWETQERLATEQCVRVAIEMLSRGGSAGAKAEKFIRDIGENSSDIIADVLREGGVNYVYAGGLCSQKVRAILDSRQSTKHICAFHADNDDPTNALSVIRNRKHMEKHFAILYKGQTLHPNVAKALKEELSKSRSIQQTHSSTKCHNILKIVIAICEVDPSAGELLFQAYSAWSKTYDARDHWAGDDIDVLFKERNLKLDKITVEKMYKTQIDNAKNSEVSYAKKFNKNKQSDPDNPTNTSDETGALSKTIAEYGGITELKSVSSVMFAILESQESAPPKIKEQCAHYLRARGYTWRNSYGKLVDEVTLLEQSAKPEIDLAMLCAKPTDTSSDRWLEKVTHIAARLPVTDATWAEIRKVSDMYYKEQFRHSSKAYADAITVIDDIRAAVTGTLRVPMGDLSYSNPVHRALLDHSQTSTKEIRNWLLEHTGDTDVAYRGWITTGACDLFYTTGQRDSTSTTIQTRSLVAMQDDVTWPEKPKTWSDLPTIDFVPWKLPAVYTKVDNKTIVLNEEEYQVSVIKDIKHLIANAAPNAMGNCTDSYAGDIRRGTSLILAIGRERGTEINVSMYRDNPHANWTVEEIKGRHNTILDKALENSIKQQIENLLDQP